MPHPSEDKPWLFKPGQSGNPKGKPKSTWHKEQRDAIRDCIPKIVATHVRKAIDGDGLSAKLILDRVLPPQKTRDLETNAHISEIRSSGNSAEDLMIVGAEIINAVRNGDMTASQAQARLDLIAEQRKLIEVEAVQKQLDELKEKLK